MTQSASPADLSLPGSSAETATTPTCGLIIRSSDHWSGHDNT